uniref:Uncharacterized protein n=1 Tax=Plectus sambesii TaxID=2011161 RepID=A0A914XUW4_9BILA
MESCLPTIPSDDLTEALTTTTTAVNICPSAVPLFFTGIFAPGDQIVDFIPAATAPVGSTVTVNCVSGAPPTLGTVIFVNYDSGGPVQVQNLDHFPFPGDFFEQIFLTCTPSLLWDVSIRTSSGPVSGIVSQPKAIKCII